MQKEIIKNGLDADVVIKVEGLHKKFCRNLRRSMFYGALDVARDMIGISRDRSKLRTSEFFALEDINFEVKKGEAFGLVGANGSGKSTLLRLINGIFPPDLGSITVKGRIGALIAVGAGFHPHMTGRENIYLNGTILGMTRKEINEKFQEIIDFAEIGEFIDAPVSTYSSGMYVRLGFAIAVHSHPDIMLVDEILAVGDSKFQRKCLDKIREMRDMGVTFFLVTHNMQTIEAMCSRVLLMHEGRQVMIGTPQNIVPTYELMLQGELSAIAMKKENIHFKNDSSLKLIFKYNDFGTNEISINSLKLFNNRGNIASEFNSEDSLIIEIAICAKKNLSDVYIWASFIYINDIEDVEKDIVSLASREKVNISKDTKKIILNYQTTQLTTGRYKIGLFFFDNMFLNPYAQGYYGYFSVKKEIPTMLRVGTSTPLCWTKPSVSIENNS